MPLDDALRRTLERHLADQNPGADTSLVDDANRLWRRTAAFCAASWAPRQLDQPAMELACFALQLPLLSRERPQRGRQPRTEMRLTRHQRAQQAADQLAQFAGSLDAPATNGRRPSSRSRAALKNQPPSVSDSLLARTCRLLVDMAQPRPAADSSRLLADALNLDDFGVAGLAQLALDLGRRGQGVGAVLEGVNQREQYGYWEARLKEGFWFPPVRDLARRRLDNYRKAAALIQREMHEDAGA